MIARVLRESGCSSDVIDAYSFPEPVEAIADLCTGSERFGISVHGTPALAAAQRLLHSIRERSAVTHAVIGGNLANVDISLVSEALQQDVTVYGGGAEECTQNVIDALLYQASQTIAFSHVEPSWILPDLAALRTPFGYYASDPDFEYPFPTQIGCPYRCFHCGTGRPGLFRRSVRRPIASMMEELEAFDRECRNVEVTPRLWITDETFTADLAHVAEVCEMFIRHDRPHRWRAQTRIDCVTPEILIMMRRAGCELLALGVEAPSDEGLRLFGKNEVWASAEAAFRHTFEAGIQPQAIIVFGAPQDLSSPHKTFQALKLVGAKSLQSYIYHPVPGSPWWRKHGRALEPNLARDWAALDFHSPPVTPVNNRSEVVASFLASLVWSTEEPYEAATSWRRLLEAPLNCERCDCVVALTPVFTDDAVAVYMVKSDPLCVVAVGSIDIVRYRAPDSHDNIMRHVEYLTDLDIFTALTYICPTCDSSALGSAQQNVVREAGGSEWRVTVRAQETPLQ